MIVLEFKLKGKPYQFRAIDEAIRVTQFIRNRCVHLWRETRGLGPADLSAYCRLLAQERAFVRKLNSMARQAAAERAWTVISRFWCVQGAGWGWGWGATIILPVSFWSAASPCLG